MKKHTISYALTLIGVVFISSMACGMHDEVTLCKVIMRRKHAKNNFNVQSNLHYDIIASRPLRIKYQNLTIQFGGLADKIAGEQIDDGVLAGAGFAKRLQPKKGDGSSKRKLTFERREKESLIGTLYRVMGRRKQVKDVFNRRNGFNGFNDNIVEKFKDYMPENLRTEYQILTDQFRELTDKIADEQIDDEVLAGAGSAKRLEHPKKDDDNPKKKKRKNCDPKDSGCNIVPGAFFSVGQEQKSNSDKGLSWEITYPQNYNLPRLEELDQPMSKGSAILYAGRNKEASS